MKIILLDDVAKVGRRGEVKEVADGYARNFLIPKKMALQATEGNLANLTQIKRRQETLVAKTLAEARTVAEQIEALSLTFPKKAGEEGKLYGSVTNADIVDALEPHRITIDKRKVQLDEPIKSLGEHIVPIKLHAGVTAHLKLSVVPKE